MMMIKKMIMIIVMMMMITTTTIIIIIIIIIIALKGAIRDSLQSPPCAANCLHPTRTLEWPGRNHVQITCNTWGAYYVRHAVVHMVLGRAVSVIGDAVTAESPVCRWVRLADTSGAGIMEVTTVFTVQPSFHHGHSTNRAS